MGKLETELKKKIESERAKSEVEIRKEIEAEMSSESFLDKLKKRLKKVD